jgi:NAD(P)-dependent dehydrogenase (short-subunit alcohol dehydrogenase family)
MFSLRGRTALVTGAGSGIGAAVAKAMARAAIRSPSRRRPAVPGR